MSRKTQPALLAGRPDTVLLRCTNYACDFTTDERDLSDVQGTPESYARTQRALTRLPAIRAEMAARG